MYSAEIGFSQIQGTREYQEDAMNQLVYPNGFVLAVLADGIGGSHHGDVASKTVCQRFGKVFEGSKKSNILDRLEESAWEANKYMAELIDHNAELYGMGCTLLAVAFSGDKIHWLSVGDSVLYLLREGLLHRINADHSHGHQLSSAVVGREIKIMEKKEQCIKENDVLIVSSDGLHTLADQEIKTLINENISLNAQELAEFLTESVNNKNAAHQDNCSLFTLKFKTQLDG